MISSRVFKEFYFDALLYVYIRLQSPLESNAVAIELSASRNRFGRKYKIMKYPN
jgi:hypothetical protein